MNMPVNRPVHPPMQSPGAVRAPAPAAAPAPAPAPRPIAQAAPGGQSAGAGAGAGVSPFEILNQALQSNIFTPEEKKDLASFGGVLAGYVNEIKIKSSNGEPIEPLNAYLSKDSAVAALASRAQSLLGRFVDSKSSNPQ